MSEPFEPLADNAPGLHSEAPGGSLAGSQADLHAIELDLAAVEIALSRLDDGTYFTDEVTGRPISGDLLASHPLARRNV